MRLQWTDACRAFSTVPGTQQVLPQHIQLVLLISDPWGPVASPLARSEWALLGTGAPSCGCSPYSHLGPTGKILGSFHQAPLPLPLKGRAGEVGWEKMFRFPQHFLCLLPDLGEVGVTRSGDRRRRLEVGVLAV